MTATSMSRWRGVFSWAALASVLVGCGGGALDGRQDAASGGGSIDAAGAGGNAGVGGAAGGSNGRDAGPLPTVGPESLIDTPVSLATAGSGTFPSVAFSGMEYFVAWTDGRAAEFQQVFGTRVSLDGRVLDPKGIAISDLLGESSSPSVVWDGTNYLVVYERAGAIVARRFGRDGAAVDSKSFTVAGGSNQTPTAVANGATTLAVWAEKMLQTGPNKIFAARIVGGAVVDPQPVAIQTGTSFPFPKATFGGGNWCICWSEGPAGLQQSVATVRCARVRGSTGQLLDATSIVVASGVTDPYGTNQGISVSRPVVASDGTDYLVVYEEFRQDGGAERLLGARLTSTGTLRDTAAIQLASALSFQGYSVAFNAGHYQVVWSISGGLAGNRLDPTTGSVLDGSTGLPITTAGQTDPNIVSAGSGFYVTFTQGAGTTLMGSRVTADPALADGAGVPLIPSLTNSERDADIASDGVNHLLVWVDDRDGNKAVYGARLSGQTGAPLDPSALRLSSPTSSVVSPKVAFNGTN